MLLEQCEAALRQAAELAVLRRRNQRRFQRSSNEHVVSELILRIRLVKGCAAQFRKILRSSAPAPAKDWLTALSCRLIFNLASDDAVRLFAAV
jgi:head-tail adaptor